MDALKFEIQDELNATTRIKVIGVGGGGGNAVARMLDAGLTGVEFYVLNTDQQALAASHVPNKLAIGAKVTSGLGAGSDPAVGRQAALEDTEKIVEILEGADMVFITAGLGGGTGTGAAPVVASLAKELGALTVAIVTKPFAFEGPRRMKMAERGLADLASTVDTVISIPNDKLLNMVPRGTSFMEAFRVADDVLRQGVQGISDIITTPGLINRDFSDIKSIMLGMGYAMLGTATAKGEHAAVEAAKLAIAGPLAEEGGVSGARGILINITASSQLPIHDVTEACELIRAAANYEDAQINFGVVMNESLGDQVKITVIATGFQREHFPEVTRTDVRVPAPRIGNQPDDRQTMPAFIPAPEYTEYPVTGQPAEPEHVEEYATAAAAGQGPIAGPPPNLTAVGATPAAPQPQERRYDDIDLPAFLRRERKLFGRE